MPENVTTDEMSKLLNGINFRYDSNSFCFTFDSNYDAQIYDAYKVHQNSNIIIERFGSWTRKSGLSVHNPNIWSRRVSMQGVKLRAVSALSPPFVTSIESQCSSKHCFQGMYADIWHELSEKMNFTYSVTRMHEWGAIVNGSWGGMVGILEKGMADIAPTDLTVTKDRSTVIQYLPTIEETEELLFLKNPVDAFSASSYIGSFTFDAWMSIIVWIVVAPLILAGIALHSKKVNNKEFKMFHCYRYVLESLALLNTTTIRASNCIQVACVSVVFCGMLIHFHWYFLILEIYSTQKREDC